jgi:Flp pilus assembly protein TadG
MTLRKLNFRRSGAAIVEAAFVLPVILLLLIGIMSGAIMVYTADEVSNVAREGARWASVRGSDYHLYTLKPAATAADIQAYTLQQPVMLDPNRMTVTVTWQGSNKPGQYVTVDVSYDFPGLGIFGAQTFHSRSTTLMTY